MIEQIKEMYPEDDFLVADGYNEAIIGLDESSGRLIYSVSRVIEILEQDMSREDALDYFYFNIHGSYVGEKTPIWCMDMIY